MGTSGLVGPIMTYQTMAAVESPILVLIKIMVFHFLLPAVVTMGVAQGTAQDGLYSKWGYEIKRIDTKYIDVKYAEVKGERCSE